MVLKIGFCAHTNSLKKLESFQGELAKRILKLPLSQWYIPKHSNNVLLLDGIQSFSSACAVRKLKYLSKIATISKENNIANYRAFSSLVDDVESLCIVKECRELEGQHGALTTPSC